MDFETACHQFISDHQRSRWGQPDDRLHDGIGHAEMTFLRSVWWPAFQNFEWLYPEYPTIDYGDHDRYIDFAYIRGNHRVAIEIDGMGPHVKDITQEQFAAHLRRQNQLCIDGWHLLRFSYLQVEQKSRQCQQTVQQLIGRLTNECKHALDLDPVNKAILQFAVYQEAISIPDVVQHVQISRSSAFRRIQQLCAQGWFQPTVPHTRPMTYQIPGERRMLL